MRRRRPWFVFVILALVLLALVLQRMTGPARAASDAMDAVVSVSITDDRATLRAAGPDGCAEFEFTVEAWQAWAHEHLEERLAAPVRIGEQAMPPSTFDMFGAAAPSPAGDRVAFTVHAYAMLTTVSIVTVLDAVTMEVGVVSEPAFGGVDELVWSPGGRFVAYALDTAWAAGDAFRIDDLRELRPVRTLTAEDVLAAAPAGVRATEHNEWLPMFRDPTWIGNARLLVTTNDPSVGDTGERRWSVAIGVYGTTHE
jgi:hypothetical protein